MISRRTDGGYVLFEQHEHALVSGELARRWTPAPRPFESVVFAVTNHDLAWRGLDEEVLWERGRPVSFTEYPVEPKLRAYAEGIDAVEGEDPHAALLCSLHYASFVEGSERPSERRFLAGERARQRGLRAGLTGEEQENLQRNLRLLKVCDGLSLFLCLEDPGGPPRTPPPFGGGPPIDGQVITPGWDEEGALTLDPNPFPRDFTVGLPYRSVGEDGEETGRGRYEWTVRGTRRLENGEVWHEQ